METTRRFSARWLPAAETRWLALLDAYAAEAMEGNRTDEAARAAEREV